VVAATNIGAGGAGAALDLCSPPAASNPAPYMVTASLPMVPAMKSPNACGTSASA